MRRKALLSIMTLYQHDNTLFDRMMLPSKPTIIENVEYLDIFTPDKAELVSGILQECAELNILFPDPETMKEALYYWSARNMVRWQKMLNTMCYKYQPIWNVDGGVTITRTGNKNTTGSVTSSGTGSHSEQETEDSARNIDETARKDVDDVNIREVAAFDSNSWQNADKNTQDRSEVETRSTEDVLDRTVSRSGSNQTQGSESSEGQEQTSDTERTTRFGNIGVTMTQQMIEAERALSMFDFYGMIITEFKQNFCIMVY